MESDNEPVVLGGVTGGEAIGKSFKIKRVRHHVIAAEEGGFQERPKSPTRKNNEMNV
jgi:hypothetical protein